MRLRWVVGRSAVVDRGSRVSQHGLRVVTWQRRKAPQVAARHTEGVAVNLVQEEIGIRKVHGGKVSARFDLAQVGIRVVFGV